MLNNFPLWPQQASTMASRVDALYIFLLIVTGMMALLVFALVIFFAARFRHRPGVRAEQIEGSTALEITWSAIPFSIFMVIFAWGAVVYFKERTPPADATEVYVVAKQWMWKVEHAEGQREINELHVPVGRDVKLIMTSQDVIHSFYIPAFASSRTCCPAATRWNGFAPPSPACITCSARSIAVPSTPAWWARSSSRNRRSMKRG
jgi:cytochrome c oxidase subunit II